VRDRRYTRPTVSWPAKKLLGVGVALAALLGLLPLLLLRLGGQDKATLGAVEEVVLLSWNLSMPARVDTGAATSSLDARRLTLVGRDEVEFSLPERWGGQRIRTALAGWQNVRTSEGHVEKRPLVRLEIRLADRQFTTQFTLNDRSSMELPILIGRNTLGATFLVDVTRNATAPLPPSSPATRRGPSTRRESP